MRNQLKGDLHIHSNFSDGSYTVKELINKYAELNYNVLSITDHDTVIGCQEAIDYGKTKGVTVIPAMELSTHLNGEDIHVLAYFKGNNFRNKEILDYLEKQKKSRIPRIIKTLELLKEHFNIEIDIKTFIKNGDERSIATKYILDALINGGHVKNLHEAMDYIGRGKHAYVTSALFGLEEGVDFLRRNNALVVLAHPVLIRENDVETILDTSKFDGIEAFYGENKEEDTLKFIEICKKRDILMTAGSDFHDFGEVFHSDIGDISLDSENINKLLKAIDSIDA